MKKFMLATLMFIGGILFADAQVLYRAQPLPTQALEALADEQFFYRGEIDEIIIMHDSSSIKFKDKAGNYFLASYRFGTTVQGDTVPPVRIEEVVTFAREATAKHPTLGRVPISHITREFWYDQDANLWMKERKWLGDLEGEVGRKWAEEIEALEDLDISDAEMESRMVELLSITTEEIIDRGDYAFKSLHSAGEGLIKVIQTLGTNQEVRIWPYWKAESKGVSLEEIQVLDPTIKQSYYTIIIKE